MAEHAEDVKAQAGLIESVLEPHEEGSGSMRSSSGVGDSVNVVMPGYAERMEEERKQRAAIVAAIPVCPHCGTARLPRKRWVGVEKPEIYCPNEMCPVRPRVAMPDQW